MYRCNKMIGSSAVFQRGRGIGFVKTLAETHGCSLETIQMGSASSDYLSFQAEFPDEPTAGAFCEELKAEGIKVI